MTTPVNRNLGLNQPAFTQNKQRIKAKSQNRQAERTRENREARTSNQERAKRTREKRETAQAESRPGRLLGRRIDLQA